MSNIFAMALGCGSKNRDDQWLEVFYPDPVINPDSKLVDVVSEEVGYEGGNAALELTHRQIQHLAREWREAGFEHEASYAVAFQESERPVVLTILIGGVFATVITLLIAWALGAEQMILMTLAPKSVTSPIAMLVAEQLGGIAALAAVVVMFNGVLGPLFGPWLLRKCKITEPAAWGMAMGMTAHAVGTSRAIEEGEEQGAFSALAMSLLGTATALLLPLGVTLWVMLRTVA